jgi:hypothetical protein
MLLKIMTSLPAQHISALSLTILAQSAELYVRPMFQEKLDVATIHDTLSRNPDRV